MTDLQPGSAQAVYAALRRRFSDGAYAPGQRLTEMALAADLGVSRTPVREAIGRLLTDGLVVPAARGVAVAALSPMEAQHLFVLRADLEALAAELAAGRQAQGRLAPAEVDALDRAVEEVEAAVRAHDPRASAQANLALHRAIGAAAGNPFLEETLHRVWDRIAVTTVANLDDPHWAGAITEQHQAIVRAIRAGDAEAARRAAKAHIEAAGRAYKPLT
ncbi:GntR family transcriptional regulator [Nonomuraea roseoviolacea subsp. roseoviolacea]|uniref:DNA-binding GntR family transcriptional regulator n=1 Tax=Nonomuraea roseoviolacea subsp. carminata TaxID=160689 RepID=A0ABT1KFU8_9ACTN|nr:GntR family transcriptional regulator [Nonomuraea roseoviolacea]MCP2352524.1 DNA-binding GntR family transcriptional regulator [Nonomuraea roseoviolacea subsp. carminata]